MKTSSTSRSGSGQRVRTEYACTECGAVAVKWVGRCPECQAWGSLTEKGVPRATLRKVSAGPVNAPARPMVDIDPELAVARPSGVGELDRVLGGGLVPGSVVLLAGEPGVGKSTLLLSAAQTWAASGQGRVLIVTGEESAAQVRLRAERMGAIHPSIFLAAETELSAVLGHLDEVRPELVVIDSVQTIAAAEVDGSAGGVTQVRAVAAALTAAAKERGIACVLVGHVTKDGSVAGPRTLEHLVDVVLHFEGDRHSPLRMVRGVKNRFGPSDEVGCFRMTAEGIEGLVDPSEVFLNANRPRVPGTAVTVTMQGRRALPVEIQALVGPAADSAGGARRTVSGLDATRVTIALAVLQRFAGVALGGKEVIATTTGGVKVLEPAVDLALAMAVWSSVRDIPLRPRTIFLGEIGLSADIRPVPALSRRLAEAARLGFDHAVVPAGNSPGEPAGIRVDEVGDLGAAFRALGNDNGVVRWLRS
ncbi:DNA repair protein RadA [Nakamurella lactea]|uniref:DNA repair protein RadA n=1 Tax=Nakamurella lactea TaxID=459515 RepID=UPI00041A4AF5|nr:DNA repair protein RadA [Nakamurella lactea]